MTIAELQLARMRPAPLDRHTLAGFHRARRARRFNLLALIVAWTGIWLYGLGAFLTTSDIVAALDGFLPLQVAAGVAAIIVLFTGRSIDRRGRFRLLTVSPAAATVAASFGAVWLLAAEIRSEHEEKPAGLAPLQIVSL